jgi:hypothetical protein
MLCCRPAGDALPIRANGILTTVRARLYPWGVAPLLGKLRPQSLAGLCLPNDTLPTLAAVIETLRRVSTGHAEQELQRLLLERAPTFTLQGL